MFAGNSPADKISNPYDVIYHRFKTNVSVLLERSGFPPLLEVIITSLFLGHDDGLSVLRLAARHHCARQTRHIRIC